MPVSSDQLSLGVAYSRGSDLQYQPSKERMVVLTMTGDQLFQLLHMEYKAIFSFPIAKYIHSPHGQLASAWYTDIAYTFAQINIHTLISMTAAPLRVVSLAEASYPLLLLFSEPGTLSAAPLTGKFLVNLRTQHQTDTFPFPLSALLSGRSIHFYCGFTTVGRFAHLPPIFLFR
ncbi:hypothetical protein AAY473_029441, partial [Plecturocebus cupreus]